MRLINTTTLQMHKQAPFASSAEKHKYAILSHRWLDPDEDEVTYQEMRLSRQPKTKRGYIKVEQFCQLAKEAGYDYAWMDTCCIDKTSSSELQESIISMWNWYHQAEVCFVYLHDAKKGRMSTFEKAEWFDRGWTLQELLSPRHVEFYDREWQYIGNRSTLRDIISRRTRIPENVLKDPASTLRKQSIAARMSWAAGRKTTRVEDRAYSLLGLFDVFSMHTPYGVGENAMHNLQQALLRLNDESLLAWESKDPSWHALFAPSPDAFANSGQCTRLPTRMKPAEETNLGVLLASDRIIPYTANTWIIPINCSAKSSKDRIGIFVRLLERYESDEDHYIRVQVNGKGYAPASLIQQLSSHHTTEDCKILLCHSASLYGLELDINYFAADLVNGFSLGRCLQGKMIDSGMKVFTPRGSYVEKEFIKREDFIWKHCGRPSNQIYIRVSNSGCRIKGVILGFDLDYNPWCYILEHDRKAGDISIGDSKQIWDEETQYLSSNDFSKPMLAYRKHADFWRIKGSRDSGLDVFLPSRTPRSWRSRRKRSGLLDQNFKKGSQWRLSCIENGCYQPCRVTFKLQPAGRGRMIWEFDIANMYAQQDHVERFEVEELKGGVRCISGQQWLPDKDEVATLKDLGVTIHRVYDARQWLDNVSQGIGSAWTMLSKRVWPQRRAQPETESDPLLEEMRRSSQAFCDAAPVQSLVPARKRTNLEMRAYPQRSSEDDEYDECSCLNVSCIVLDCCMWCDVKRWMGFDGSGDRDDDHY